VESVFLRRHVRKIFCLSLLVILGIRSGFNGINVFLPKTVRNKYAVEQHGPVTY
jgi:hypothetical protein